MLIPFDQLPIPKPFHFALHLGAHYGEEAEAYEKLGCHRVVWVEAVPETYAELRRRIVRYPQHLALQACLSDVEGEHVTMNIASNEGQSSSILPFGTHAREHPTVRFVGKVNLVTRLAGVLLHQHQIAVPPGSFLNVDLQGVELKALRGLGDLLFQFRYAYIEVNEAELYQGCSKVTEIDEYLARFGFVGICSKMTAHGWGDKFYHRP